MTNGQPSKSSGWFTGRTRLITVVSILAVGVAGASAVSANIGILDSASDGVVGTIEVTSDLVADSVPSVVATTAAPASTVAETTVQEFAVDVAGTVSVASSASGLRLESVSPAAGWSWDLSQRSATELAVTFTNGERAFEFTAAATPDGNIAANVNEPIVTPAPATPAAPGVGGQPYDDEYDDGYDDEYDDEYDDDEYDDDEYDDDNDDDDHEEYEGRDDDD